MSKALFDDNIENIRNAIVTTYGITNPSYATAAIAPLKGLGLHLIFDDDTPSLSNVIVNRASALLQTEMLQYYSFFDLERAIPVIKAGNNNTDTRTVTAEQFTASEDQPLNADIDRITSPTAKASNNASYTDTNTRVTVDDNIKWATYLKELEAFGTHIRRIISPLIEEFSEMY